MLSLLSDPFLQLPTDSTVRVVWFTEWEGGCHWVDYGLDLERQVIASSQKIGLREDGRSHWNGAPPCVPGQPVKVIERPVWRHEAIVTELQPGDRLPYRVTSMSQGEKKTEKRVIKPQKIQSQIFQLSPRPPRDKAVQILLTSDHQMMPMVPKTLQKAVETCGDFDAVFYAGDMVNVPDRASEWFDDRRGRSFFPCFQGRAIVTKPAANQPELKTEPGVDRVTSDEPNTQCPGGEILQSTPIFPCIGNHEVMGKRDGGVGLNGEFNDPIPLTIQTKDPVDRDWIDQHFKDLNDELGKIGDRPFNTDAYESIFTLPTDSPGGKRYYATTFGPVRLISLQITNAWRWFDMNGKIKSRFCEKEIDLNHPEQWGGGQLIFEPIAKGTQQYQWLQEQLEHPEFKSATYRIVMFHHPPHSLGKNIVPPYTDPLQEIQRDNTGDITSIRYHYEKSKDYLATDVMPLLEQSWVDLVYYGHCHLWNRFEQKTERGTVHYLESSHGGNTHGAAWGENERFIPDELRGDRNYTPVGDPNGLVPIMPTLAPLRDPKTQEPIPYIAHKNMGAFSVLDTGTGEVTSYRYESGRSPIKFDVFKLGD